MRLRGLGFLHNYDLTELSFFDFVILMLLWLLRLSAIVWIQISIFVLILGLIGIGHIRFTLLLSHRFCCFRLLVIWPQCTVLGLIVLLHLIIL